VPDELVPEGVTRVEATPELVASCAAVVVLVDHDAFDLGAITAGATYVLDTRRCVQGANVEYL
jgi:UDP-N-acetyl-D-glucosamine dehydrogenase